VCAQHHRQSDDAEGGTYIVTSAEPQSVSQRGCGRAVKHTIEFLVFFEFPFGVGPRNAMIYPPVCFREGEVGMAHDVIYRRHLPTSFAEVNR